jgi:hypothetical protein
MPRQTGVTKSGPEKESPVGQAVEGHRRGDVIDAHAPPADQGACGSSMSASARDRLDERAPSRGSR